MHADGETPRSKLSSQWVMTRVNHHQRLLINRVTLTGIFYTCIRKLYIIYYLGAEVMAM